MAFTWTDKMGPIAQDPAHEKMTRDAVSAACDFIEAATEAPQFHGSTFVKPMNKSARDMATACLARVSLGPGAARERILGIAVNCAGVFKGAGGGASGWDAVGKMIAR